MAGVENVERDTYGATDDVLRMEADGIHEGLCCRPNGLNARLVRPEFLVQAIDRLLEAPDAE